jgi:hypothetical protein
MATLAFILFVVVCGMTWDGVREHRHRMRMAREIAVLKATNEVYEAFLASTANLNEGMSGMRSVGYIAQQNEPGVRPGRSRIIISFNDEADRVAVHQALHKIWMHWAPQKDDEPVLRFGSVSELWAYKDGMVSPDEFRAELQRTFD